MSAIIDRVDQLLRERETEVHAWLDAARAQTPPFIYTSVDLRHSGVKIAPVDTNLFPAGFNNLSAAARDRATAAFRAHLSRMRGVKSILIIPENHTRNLAYLDNLHVLSSLIAAAGYETRIGNLSLAEPITLTSLSGHEILESPVRRAGDALETADGFRADAIVLNNDLTSGMPEPLSGLSQPILPPPGMGWYRRRKTVHFSAYDRLLRGFANDFGIDPWLLSTIFHCCGRINFHERTGIECVALNADKVIHAVRRKYEEHGITEEPYVFIKADSGTYGMGIMTVRSGEELFEMNKKTRNKMNVIKEGAQNSEVIIQEGIPTVDRVKDGIAEPMIYMVDGTPVGGAYRVNRERDAFNNLNASGMEFTGMCDETEGSATKVKIASCNFRVFGFIGQLASLAAAREEY